MIIIQFTKKITNMHADIPDRPKSGNCSLNRNEKSVVITLEMPRSRDTDLDYFKVKLYTGSRLLKQTDIKVPTTVADDGWIKFIIGSDDDVFGEDVRMNVTTFDKCGQPSSQPLSMPCPNGNHNYQHDCTCTIILL